MAIIRLAGSLGGAYNLLSGYGGLRITAAYNLVPAEKPVGFFDSQYSLPDPYPHSHALVHGTYSIAAVSRIQGGLSSQYGIGILSYAGFKFHSQARLGAHEHRTGFLTGTHGIPDPVTFGSWRLTGSHGLPVYDYIRGWVSANHVLDAFSRGSRLFQASANLYARNRILGSLQSRYAISCWMAQGSRLNGNHALLVRTREFGYSTQAYNLDVRLPSRSQVSGTYSLSAWTKANGCLNGTHGLDARIRCAGVLDTNYAILIDEFNDALTGIVTWAVNGNTGAASVYRRYPFHSYAQIPGAGLGAASDGIYYLNKLGTNGHPIDNTPAGATAIAAEIVTPWYDFQQPEIGGLLLKRVLSIVFGGYIGAVDVIPELDDEDYIPVTYRAENNLNPKRVRVKFKRGLKTRQARFTIRNVAGKNLEIESFDIEVEHLGSRAR